MKKTYRVERVFPLGDNFRNVRLAEEVELEGEEIDINPAKAVYDSIFDDIYTAYFEHKTVLDEMKKNADGAKKQIDIWKNRNV